MARSSWFDIGHGCEVEFRANAQPDIQWDHIDGPLLHSRFAQIKWLTWCERFLCWIGREDAQSLERKHWPKLAERWDARAQSEDASRKRGE